MLQFLCHDMTTQSKGGEAMKKKLLVWILLCAMLVTDIPARAAVDGDVSAAADLSESAMAGEERAGKVFYISTAKELIDILQAYNFTGTNSYYMPEYAYFELVNDIDLSGYVWEPVNLNGMFNGNGHTIRNITIKKYGGIGTSTEKYAGFFAMGLNSWKKDYVTNLHLENVEIEVGVDESSEITRLGVAPVIADTTVAINNCSVSGSILVISESDTVDIAVKGFKNVSGCQGEMDIEVKGKMETIEATAISESANTQWEGDITVNTQGESSDVEAAGIHAGNGCTYTGNVDVHAKDVKDGTVTAYGIFGKECHMKGNVTLESGKGNAYLYGLGGTGCFMEGNIQAEGGGEVEAVAMSNYVANYNPAIVGDLKESSFAGNVTVEAKKMVRITGMDAGESCQFNGNIHAVSSEDTVDATGIEDTSGSFFFGEIFARGNSDDPGGVCVYGVAGENNYFKGDIHAENTYIEEQYTSGGEAVAVGSSGTNCYVEGNLTAIAEEPSAFGLTGEDSYFYGNISVNASEDGFGALISSDYSGNIAEGKVNIHSSGSADGALIDGYGASNNYAEGDLCVSGAERSWAEGITEDVGTGNHARGTVTAEVTGAGDEFRYINASGSSGGSTFEGTVTGICNGLSGTVSQTGETLYFMRGEGGTLFLSTDDSEGFSAAGFITVGSGGEVTPPEEEWSPSEGEEEKQEKVYSLRFIDILTDQPVTDAVVGIDGEYYTTDNNGMITVKGDLFIQNLEVQDTDVPIHTQSRFFAAAGRTNTIYVNGLNFNLNNIVMGKLGETTINGPEANGFSLFELPISFDLSILDQMQIAYDAEKKTYQVIVTGSGEYSRETDGIANAREPAWKKAYEEFKYQFTKGVQDFRSQSFKGVNRDFGTKNANVRAGGYLEFAVTDEGLRMTDGEMLVRVKGDFSSSYPIPPAPYIYLKFGVETSLQTRADFEFKNNDIRVPEVIMTADMGFQLMPSLGIGAGLHKILSAEVGIEGPLDVSLRLPFISMEENVKVTMSAKAYLLITALAFNMKFSETFLEHELYPGEKEEENGKVSTFAAVPDTGELSLIDRSYLNGAAARSVDEGNQDTIRNRAYPYGTVQSVSLPDGRTLVVWLDDDTQRNLMDKTSLYYSIIQNGEWSVPAQIEADGTADFSFDLCETDSGAAIVWQDTRESLPENTDADTLAESIDLSFAEFNSETNTFGTVISLTGENGEESAGTKGTGDNTIYEYSPKLAANEHTVHVIWNQNAANHVVPGEEITAESICYMKVQKSSGEWKPGTAEIVEDNLPLVYEAVVGDTGVVAYLTDDGEGEESAKVLSIKEMDGQERTQQYSNNTDLSDLQYKEGKLYFSEEENVKTLSLWNEYASILASNRNAGDEQTRVVYRNGQPEAVITEVQDGLTSNLYISYRNNGVFTNPVPITDFDEKIRSWDVSLNEDGSVDVSALLIHIEVGETKNEMTETARLVHTTAKPMEDIVLSEIFTEEDHVGRGSMATFLLNVENNTKEVLESLDVSVKDSTGGTLYEGTYTTFIEGGDTGTLSVDVPIPADFTMQELTFTVTGDMEEKDTDNNSGIFLAGAANLVLEMDGSHIHSDGYLEAVITNNGSADASGVQLKVTGEDETVIFKESAGNVPAGEEKRVMIPVEESKRSFNKDSDSYGITAEISCDEEESTEIDNEAAFRIRPPQITQIVIAESMLNMALGETYKPTVQVYPSDTLNKEYVVRSGDENVVSVDADGTITAKAEGTADIIFMAVNSSAAARVSVTVGGSDAENLHKISLDAGGGTVSPRRLEVQEGQTAVLPCPMREGYYFAGWYNAPEGGNEITSETAITQDMTLYARWTDTRSPNPELPEIDNPDPDDPNPDDPDNPDPDVPNPNPGETDPDDPDPDTPSPEPTPGGDPGSGTTSQPGTPTQPGGSGTTPQPGGSGAGTGQTGNKTPQAAAQYRVGDIVTASGLRYRVTDARSAQGQVQMIGAAGAAKKTVNIPAEILSPSTGQRFKVTAIGNNAFKNQKKLRKLTIGKNVRVIGKKAFFNCKKLKNITMKTKTLTKKTVGAKAFRGIYARASVKVPKKKRTLYRKILRARGVGVQVRIR